MKLVLLLLLSLVVFNCNKGLSPFQMGRIAPMMDGDAPDISEFDPFAPIEKKDATTQTESCIVVQAKPGSDIEKVLDKAEEKLKNN